MRTLLLTSMILICPKLLFCDNAMYVSLCNSVQLPAESVARAKTEANLAFEPAGVQIVWVPCDGIVSAKLKLGDQLFVLRLLGSAPRRTTRNVSLEAMGRAYTPEEGPGSLADAYLPAIDSIAQTRYLERDALLGLVISHELGHLLLGPGHVPEGIMCGTWRSHEMDKLRKRWLRFDAGEAESIRMELEKRAESNKAR